MVLWSQSLQNEIESSGRAMLSRIDMYSSFWRSIASANPCDRSFLLRNCCPSLENAFNRKCAVDEEGSREAGAGMPWSVPPPIPVRIWLVFAYSQTWARTAGCVVSRSPIENQYLSRSDETWAWATVLVFLSNQYKKKSQG